MRLASETSCSAVSSGTCPISRRYVRTGSPEKVGARRSRLGLAPLSARSASSSSSSIPISPSACRSRSCGSSSRSAASMTSARRERHGPELSALRDQLADLARERIIRAGGRLRALGGRVPIHVITSSPLSPGRQKRRTSRTIRRAATDRRLAGYEHPGETGDPRPRLRDAGAPRPFDQYAALSSPSPQSPRSRPRCRTPPGSGAALSPRPTGRGEGDLPPRPVLYHLCSGLVVLGLRRARGHLAVGRIWVDTRRARTSERRLPQTLAAFSAKGGRAMPGLASGTHPSRSLTGVPR